MTEHRISFPYRVWESPDGTKGKIGGYRVMYGGVQLGWVTKWNGEWTAWASIKPESFEGTVIEDRAATRRSAAHSLVWRAMRRGVYCLRGSLPEKLPEGMTAEFYTGLYSSGEESPLDVFLVRLDEKVGEELLGGLYGVEPLVEGEVVA